MTGDSLTDGGGAKSVPAESDEGHHTALAELYGQKRLSLLRRLTARCNSRAEAEDILHEALGKLLGLDRPGTSSFLGALLWKTCLNLIIDRGRQRTTHAGLNHLVTNGCEEFAPSPEEAVHQAQSAAAFEEALDGLQRDEPTWYEAFILRTQHEFSWEDVANRMGVGARMAQVYVARAAEYCQRHLESQKLLGTRRKSR